MENEIWEDIVGYEGLYQISNLANIRSLEKLTRKGIRILRTSLDKDGYSVISLRKGGVSKTRKVH